ncbi:hypothetical protein F511_43795 [Dorcoceras hygrometricum]|uniref:Uncharacterized protein n=1 Tax=Dorcoceras hygrometricum TaxID=472368 RepID=A0A2Z7A5X9_9LAMI|nr:hypothetical protein F511_44614 [Dorcoceras hygrometricum]KZV14290.1 hypothetical protein F511_43795 [Dorcoceras hygrometricum]
MSAWGNDVYWREVSFSGNQICHLGEHDVYWREVFVRWLIVLWTSAMYCGSSSDVMEIVWTFRMSCAASINSDLYGFSLAALVLQFRD